MGTIIGSKVRDDGKIIFEVCMGQDEALQLKGEVDNISLVPLGKKWQDDTKIVQRGKNEATMYFLIPKNERDGLKKANKAKFQKITAPMKTLYIYTVKNE